MMTQMIHDPCSMLRRQSHASCSTSSAPYVASTCRLDGLPRFRRGRKVVCHNVNDFRRSFQSSEPGRSNQHPNGDEEPAARTPGVGSIGQRTYQVIGDQLPPYVQQRLATDGPPGAGAALLEELAILDEESNRWPSIAQQADGTYVFNPGFLLRLVEPLPPEFVLGNGFWRVFQLAVVAAYAAAAVMAAKFALESNFNLGLALLVTWARDLLTPGRLLLICTMAWFGNLWLYWVFFVGARIDDILQRIAPPIRFACWTAFSLWAIYVLLSPVWHHPTPWFVFAPGNSPFQHMNLMRS